jgi:hypothetical protein
VGVCSLANGLTPVLPLCPARTGMDRDTLRTPDAATSRFVYGEGWNCFLEPTKAVKARRSKSSTKLFTPAPNTVKRPRLSRGENLLVERGWSRPPRGQLWMRKMLWKRHG